MEKFTLNFKLSLLCLILAGTVHSVRSQAGLCNATAPTDTLHASPWTVCYSGTTDINGCDPSMNCPGNSDDCPLPLNEASIDIWPDGLRDVAGGCGPLITENELQVDIGTDYFRPTIAGFVYDGADRHLFVNSARNSPGAQRVAIVNPDTFAIEASANINGQLMFGASNPIIVGDYVYLSGTRGRILPILARDPVLTAGNFVVPPSPVTVSSGAVFQDVVQHPNYADILIFVESSSVGAGIQIVSISNPVLPVLMSESTEKFLAVGIDCKNFGDPTGVPNADRYVICAVIVTGEVTNIGYIYRIDGMYGITRISTFDVVTLGGLRNVLMHPTKPVAYVTRLGSNTFSRNMLFAIDLSDPYAPVVTSSVKLLNSGSYISAAQNSGMHIGGLNNQYLYLVSGGFFGSTGGFVFTGVCIRDPVNPVRVSQYNWENSLDKHIDTQSVFTDPSNSTMFRMYIGSGDNNVKLGRIDAHFCGNGLYGSDECGSTGGPCCDLQTCDYISGLGNSTFCNAGVSCP